MKMSVTTKSALTASGELLSWDTEFWGGRRIARGFSPELDKWAIDNTIRCMCLLIDAADHEAIHRAEANGARLMDTRVEFSRPTGSEMAVSRRPTPADVDELAAIARTAFRGLTRFYADPRFDNARCDDLYEEWFLSSYRGWAMEVLMIGDGLGPAGFVTIHDDGDREASIGLIATAPRIRGRGMGLNLTHAAVDWAYRENFETITVVTQGCNIPAQRAFQRAGFVTESVDVWLHKWYDD